MTRMRSMVLLAALAVAGPAIAAGRGPLPGREAWRVDGSPTPTASSITLLQTGFEPGDGYAPGPLHGQSGWATSSPYGWCAVAGVHPWAGVQHVRLLRNEANAAGSLQIAVSPDLGPLPPCNNRFTGMIYVSADSGADYVVFGQAPSQGFLTWEVVFSWSDDSGTGPGTIYVLDDRGSGLQLVNTGVAWTPGAWRQLRVDFEWTSRRIRYYYGGLPVYVGSIYAGISVEQVGFLHDNHQNPGESADMDDFRLEDLSGPPVPAEATTWGRLKALAF